MAPTASADMDFVLKLIPEVEDIPASARTTLVAGLQYALGPPVAERHSFQTRLGTAAQEAMQAALAAAEQRLSSAREGAAAAVAAQANSKERSEEAAKASAAAGGVVSEKAEQLQARRQEMAKLEQEHTGAEVAKTRVVEARDKTRAEQAQLVAATEDLQSLAEGTCTDKEVAAEAVQAYIKAHGAEPTLVAAASAALKRDPAGRGAFEKLAVDCISEMLRAKAADLESRLASGQEEEADAVAEALGLWALFDQERERELDARAELGEAKVALEAAASSQKQAEAFLVKKEEEASRRLVDQTLAEERLAQLKLALEALDRLVHCSYEQPKAPEQPKVVEQPLTTTNSLGVPTPITAGGS